MTWTHNPELRTATRFALGARVKIVGTFAGLGHESVGKVARVVAITAHDFFNGGTHYELRNEDGTSNTWLWYDGELEAAPLVPARAPIFLVWREPSIGRQYDMTPTRSHATRDAAESEAVRLACKFPGARFHVVQSIVDVEVEIPLPTKTEHAAPCANPEGPQG